MLVSLSRSYRSLKLPFLSRVQTMSMCDHISFAQCNPAWSRQRYIASGFPRFLPVAGWYRRKARYRRIKSAMREEKYQYFRPSPQTTLRNYTFSTVTTILWEKLRANSGSRISCKWSVVLEAQWWRCHGRNPNIDGACSCWQLHVGDSEFEH
jgi:hypothetical protein